jgi:alpha-tubulin suppressor-like RCC1 family protein
VALVGAVTSIATGGEHGCAVVEGEVQCWGNNADAQVSVLNIGSPQNPQLVAGISATKVVSGPVANHTCALDENLGKAHCWGSNSAGQIPGGTSTMFEPPTPIESVTDPTAIPVGVGLGLSSTCVVFESPSTSDTFVECWGNLGLQDGLAHRTIPTGSAQITNRLSASRASTFLIALDTGSYVSQAFGKDILGSLGLGVPEGQITPTPTSIQWPDPLHSPRSVVAGLNTVCALIYESAGLYCWGANPLEEGLVNPNELVVESYNTPQYRLLSN